MPACTWAAVTCEHGEVVGLRLDDLHPRGTLPSQLAQLQSLRELNADFAEISGTLPSSLASLTHLQDLQVAATQLSGTLPSWLHQLGRLKALDIDTTWISGTIPQSIGQLVELKAFGMWFQTWLSGTLPTTLGLLTRNVNMINLFRAPFSGTLPTQIGRLSDINGIYLSSTRLSGTLPTELASMTRLGLFCAGTEPYCGATGNWVSSGQAQCLRSPRGCSHDVPRFSGTLPAQWSSRLMALNLTGMPVSGTLPIELALHAGILQDVVVTQTRLSGTIPQGLAASFAGKHRALPKFGRLGDSYITSAQQAHASRRMILDTSESHISGSLPAMLYYMLYPRTRGDPQRTSGARPSERTQQNVQDVTARASSSRAGLVLLLGAVVCATAVMRYNRRRDNTAV